MGERKAPTPPPPGHKPPPPPSPPPRRFDAIADGQSLHVRFEKAITEYKIVQGAEMCEFSAESGSRERVQEYIKLAYTALRAMKGERFDIEIRIRNVDPGGTDGPKEGA